MLVSMRLHKIKLAGFKSFVDPTVLELKTALVAVVGPNGCGKSNIIDAVRWVMGESSAKHLRGESMTDVIFNGSTTRKPVGQATVELFFDNSDGSLGGEYASYAEISVRRQVTRDSQVSYYLNGTKCRRKDITDIFLGTGLGPRSYAIIEQGMISRVVEAKPEELRSFFEEAAGIALYKKRRQETETRMRHTRENLVRLEDMRQEQEKQIEKLKRQSEAAIKYKALKQEADALELKLTALKWQEVESQQKLKNDTIREYTIVIEKKQAEKVSIDLALEKGHAEYTEEQDTFNTLQSKMYALGAEIAAIEQNIQHHYDKERKLKEDLELAKSQIELHKNQIEEDKAMHYSLEAEYATLEPELLLAQAKAEEFETIATNAEEALRLLNVQWDEFQTKARATQTQAEVQRARIEQFEKQITENEARLNKLHNENTNANTAAIEEKIYEFEARAQSINDIIEEKQIEYDQLQALMQGMQLNIKEKNSIINTLEKKLQTLQGRNAALHALQEAALKRHIPEIKEWLVNHNIPESYLGENLSVEQGWEAAVEITLNHKLKAFCTEQINEAIWQDIEQITEGNIHLLANGSDSLIGNNATKDANLLIHKIKTSLPIYPFLAGIYAASTIAQARELVANLEAHESVITPEGIWLGPNWISICKGENAEKGVLARDKEQKLLSQEIALHEVEIEQLVAEVDSMQTEAADSEGKSRELQKNIQELTQELNEVSKQSSIENTKLQHVLLRQKNISEEIQEFTVNIDLAQEEASKIRYTLENALNAMEGNNKENSHFQEARERLRAENLQASSTAKQNAAQVHAINLKVHTLKTQIQGMTQGLERLEKQRLLSSERLLHLESTLLSFDEPLLQFKEQLDELLALRLEVEMELQVSRTRVEELEHSRRHSEKLRHQLEIEINDIRNNLETVRLDWQTLAVRRETLLEKLQAAACDIDAVLQSLEPELDEAEAEIELEKLLKKIQNLGLINLAAIEEYESELERKSYLDMQYTDLTDALDTLENAIRKIDKETRQCFSQTFEKINNQFQILFPKLFGGGQAYLELTGEDLLEAGVSIMARPPGKRNSSIHLLSGGEKALTAVALVFSIFQLNPAPFCMLDEVDAPLDDANVGRFCELVKYMAQTVQFIFITHNKLAMEMAQHLAGVTMKEPGVSRLVTVDVEEATALVTQ